MVGFFAINSAEPLVIYGIPGIEGHGFFGAGDCGVMLLGLVVGLSKKQIDFSVARMLFRGSFQDLGGFGVVAGIVGFVGSFKTRIARRIVDCCASAWKTVRQKGRGK